MARSVKNGHRSARRIRASASVPAAPPAATTKISSKHQVTIAKAPFDEAGFKAGDVVTVRAVGPGRVELTSLDALLERYRGCISTNGRLRREIDAARDEWA